ISFRFCRDIKQVGRPFGPVITHLIWFQVVREDDQRAEGRALKRRPWSGERHAPTGTHGNPVTHLNGIPYVGMRADRNDLKSRLSRYLGDRNWQESQENRGAAYISIAHFIRSFHITGKKYRWPQA